MEGQSAVVILAPNWEGIAALGEALRNAGFNATPSDAELGTRESVDERANADAVVIVWTAINQTNAALRSAASLGEDLDNLVNVSVGQIRVGYGANAIAIDAWLADQDAAKLAELVERLRGLCDDLNGEELSGGQADDGALGAQTRAPAFSPDQLNAALQSVVSPELTSEEVRDASDLIAAMAEEAEEVGEVGAMLALLRGAPETPPGASFAVKGALSNLALVHARLALHAGEQQEAIDSARKALALARDVFLAGDIHLVAPLELVAEVLGPEQGELFALEAADIRSGAKSVDPGVLGAQNLPHVTVPVLFATTRQLRPGAKPWLAASYGGKAQRALIFGEADVSVEKDPDIDLGAKELDELLGAKLDLASILQGSADASFLRLTDTEEEWVAKFAARIGDKREALLYVHGFATTLERALIQAGRLAVRLNLEERAVAVFSWPSDGCRWLYPMDRTQLNDASSALGLARVIRALAAKIGHGNLNVVAHSLGSQFLLDALTRMAGEKEVEGLLRHVVFASPDLPKGVLENWDQDIDHLSRRITVYASRGDRALAILSRLINQRSRQGASTKPDKEDARFDTIDTTTTLRIQLGHSDYVGGAINDVRGLIWNDLDPEQRPFVRKSKRVARTFRLRRLHALGRKLGIHLVASLMARTRGPRASLEIVERKLEKLDDADDQLLIGRLLIIRRDFQRMIATAEA